MPEAWMDAIVIKYDPVTRSIDVSSKLSAFESFGILEAAKQMIAKDWLDDEK